jgi:Uma2 family endonuclease
MAMPALESQYWTAAEVRALPDDGKRYECIDGQLLVTPAPRYAHQAVVKELLFALQPFVTAQSLGALCISPADVEIEPSTIVQPDLFVARASHGSVIRNWTDISDLLLAIEVLSPGTARYDRGLKRRFYQRNGVDEYWIVDLDSQLVERWQAKDERPEVLVDEVRWAPANSTEPLRIDLAALFERALK